MCICIKLFRKITFIRSELVNVLLWFLHDVALYHSIIITGKFGKVFNSSLFGE